MSIKSNNQKLKRGKLVGYTGGSVTLVDDYIYYGGDKGKIFRAPINNLQNFKKIYQISFDDYMNHFPYSDLKKKDGYACLKYHHGGASMGADYYVKFTVDGSNEEVESGYLSFKKYGNLTIKVDCGFLVGPGNLKMQYDNQEEKSIGDGHYQYAPSDFYLINDTVYITAREAENFDADYNLYRVNINNEETARVSDLKVDSFKVCGNYIYATSDKKLYKIPLKGGIEKLVKIEGSISPEVDMQVLNGSVYYVNGDNGELYKIGSEESLNPRGKVDGMKIEDEYLIVSFIEEPNNPYRIMAFDKNGKIVFKTSDVAKNDIENIFIDKGILGYIENTTNNLYTTELL